jgi:hypothetical protein
VVDAHNEHGSIGGRSGNDYLLGAAHEVSGGLFGGGELTGGLDYVLRAALAPGDLLGIHAVVNIDYLAVYDELAVYDLDFTVELAVNGVVPEKVGHIINVKEGIVDARNYNVGVLDSRTENETTDTTEAIDTNFCCHKKSTSNK